MSAKPTPTPVESSPPAVPTPAAKQPRVLSEEERKKLVDAAVDASIAANAELLSRLAK